MRKMLYILLITFAFQLTANGQLYLDKKWDYKYGGNTHDELSIVIQTPGNGFLLCGSSTSTIGFDKTEACHGTKPDWWVVKIDSNGVKEWDHVYGTNEIDFITGAAITVDGGYILLGFTDGGISGEKTGLNVGEYDYWIVKIDSAGDIQWDKTFGGIDWDISRNIIQTPDRGYLISGVSVSPAGGDKTENNWDATLQTTDLWVIKTDSTGNKIFDKRYGGTGEETGRADIILSPDGGYVIGCTSNSDSSGNKTQNAWSQSSSNSWDFWIFKVDTLGNIIWDNRYGSYTSETFGDFIQTNGGWLLTGTSSGPFQVGSGDQSEGGDRWGDYWVIFIDSLRNKVWDNTYHASGDFSNMQPYGKDDLYDVISTGDGGYLLCGESNSLNFGDKSETNLGLYQTWIVSINSAGQIRWDKTILTPHTTGYSFITKTGEDCYVVFNTSAGSGGHKTQQGNSDDYWAMKFCHFPVGLPTNLSQEADIQIYPNPTASEITISMQKMNLSHATFTLYNSTGQVIYFNEDVNLSDTYQKMLDISNLPAGAYFMEVVIDNKKEVKQIIKQ